jgi:hypothetical protein
MNWTPTPRIGLQCLSVAIGAGRCRCAGFVSAQGVGEVQIEVLSNGMDEPLDNRIKSRTGAGFDFRSQGARGVVLSSGGRLVDWLRSVVPGAAGAV